MTEAQKSKILAEFGPIDGAAIIEEREQIEQYCINRGIKYHSISADGNCNMGCC